MCLQMAEGGLWLTGIVLRNFGQQATARHRLRLPPPGALSANPVNSLEVGRYQHRERASTPPTHPITTPQHHNTMAKTLVSALALASLPSALAFRNTSPFFLFSTAEYACSSSP